MDYRTFIEMMKEQVQKHLGKEYEVQITTNPKLKWFLLFIWKNVLRDICRRENLQNMWKKSV